MIIFNSELTLHYLQFERIIPTIKKNKGNCVAKIFPSEYFNHFKSNIKEFSSGLILADHYK